ncbi:MAG: hypothetical protein ABJB12_02580 [Pseudomonadota bacterium]
MAITASGLAYACSSSTGTDSSARPAGSGGASAALTIHGAGSADRSEAASAGKSPEVSAERATSDMTGSAGMTSDEDTATGEGGSAGEGTSGFVPPPADALPTEDQAHTQCDLNGGCVSKCTDQTVTCTVQSLGFACEMEGFVGASKEVACGQRAVVGTACCGGCGCVPVEVFFDGTSCWQGIPACTTFAFTNKFYDPHGPGGGVGAAFSLPGSVPGSFFLGAAGADFGAPPAAGGAGSAGSAGTPSGGTAGVSDGSGGAGAPAGGSAGTGTAGASAGNGGAGSAGSAGSAGASAGSAGASAGNGGASSPL